MTGLHTAFRLVVSGALALAFSSPLHGAEAKRFAGAEDPRSGDWALLWKMGASDAKDVFARAARIGREELKAEREREAFLRKTGRAPLADATRWASLGPDEIFFFGGDGKGGQVSGMVADLRVHPTDPKTLWAGTSGGGVWKSTDGGQSWKPTMDDLGRIQIGAVEVSPSNPKRVYAGSGCGDSSTYVQNYPGLGLLVSDDGGGTWRTTASGNVMVGGAFYELSADPASADVVVAATTNGLFLTENGGDTWETKKWGKTTSLSRCKSVPQRLYATVLGMEGNPTLWTSEDGGRAWVELPQAGLIEPAWRRGRTEIAVSPQDPLRVYLLVADKSKGTTLDFALSNDGGRTWQSTAPDQSKNGILGEQGNYFAVLAVDPSSRDTVWAGGLDLWKSTDAGRTFRQVSSWKYPPDKEDPPNGPFVHADQHAYVFGPDGTPYFTTDGGIFTTKDGGASFVPLNKGLVTLQLYTVCASALDPVVTLGGAQDNGPYLRSADGKWTQMSTGDGMGCLTHATNPLVLHAAVQQNYVGRTLDGGKTFKESITGLTDAGEANGNFMTPLRRSPSRPDTIYTISNWRLWVSDDNGGLWRRNGSGPVDSAGNPISLRDFTVLSPDGSRIAVAGSEGRILETLDEGATWRAVATLPGGRTIATLRYDRRDPKVIWACSATGEERAERVWRTTAAGGWEVLSRTGQEGGLPDVPVFTVAQDPDDPAAWYAGTFIGLYRSGNDGKTWQRHGLGLPNVIVTDVDFYRTGKMVRIATLGRGAWEVSTTAPPQGPTAQILFPSEGTSVPQGGVIRFIGTGASALPGGTVTYRWSWGDQSPDSPGATPPHLFAWHGTYTVKLTVTDGTGASTTVSREIVVRTTPPSGGGKASLQGGAVQVEVDFHDPYTDLVDEATPKKQAETFAYFSFGDPNNPEVFVKVLDFGSERPYLLYWAGLTSFEYAVTFTATATGKTASFIVPAASYKGGYDGLALPHSGGAALLSRDGSVVTRLGEGMERGRELALLGELRALGLARRLSPGGPGASSLLPEPAAAGLLLAAGQVSVTLAWTDPRTGEKGSGVALPQGDAFGYFYFKDASNPEVFVKVLDFGPDRPFLLYWAGLTDFEYVVTYTNVKTGKTFTVTKKAGSFDGGANTTGLPH